MTSAADRLVVVDYPDTGAHEVRVPVPDDGADAFAGALVVSPHPDDAVLALGAALAGSSARVVTPFSVETATRLPYYAERPAVATRLLVEEDVAALSALGLASEYLGYVDAPDRAAWDGTFRCDNAARVAAAEPALLASLMDAIASRAAGCVVAPLAIGGHVDHVLCREAVLRLRAEGRVRDVALYADMPYAVLRLGGAAGAPLPDVGVALAEEPLPSSPDRRTAKEAVLACYRLQVSEPVARRVARAPERLYRVR